MPFLFPYLAERFMVTAVCVAIVTVIAILLLFPIAVIALIFTYEGYSVKGAIAAADKLLARARGKIYFLTIFLLLCALILNLTPVGMIFVFPH